MTRRPEIVPDELLEAHERHLRGIDPWLGGVSLAGAGNQDGSSILLTVDGAAGVARRDTVSTADMVALYGKLTRYQLQAVWAGDAQALDELVSEWSTWAKTHTPQPLDPETEASMRVPARDVAAGRVLLSHGLVPATTIAIRPAGRTAPPGTASDLTIRRATEADVPAILDLAVEEFHYESGLSVLTSRPNQRELLGPELLESVRTEQPWAWVAVEHDRPVAVLRMSPPGEARWIGEVSRRQPVAYLGLLSVTESHRGRGVGAALVEVAHRQADAAGASASLLHYGTFNPLSVPFWSRMGYRPLWSVWQATPVAYLR